MNNQQALSSYVGSLAQAAQQHNANIIPRLLHFNNRNAGLAVQGALMGGPFRPEGVCAQHFKNAVDGESWARVVLAHVRGMFAFHSRKYEEAYSKLVEGSEPLRSLFEATDDYWMVDTLIQYAKNLSRLARLADAELRRSNKNVDTMSRCDACADEIRKYFPIMNRSKQVGKKIGALSIVNILFRMYFQMNNVRLCKNLIRAMDTPQALPFDRFPVAQKVTYKYYLGRLAIFDEDLRKAEAELTWALNRCHPRASGNKGRILDFLVPVKLLMGRLPTAALVAKYDLTQYEHIVIAMRTGDVGLLASTLQENQYRFIQSGTYLLLEKLKQVTYRRLLKQVKLVNAQDVPNDKAHIVPLDMFQAALGMQGVPMEMEEVECIVANLIYMGYVKGYLSHKMKKCVLSKKDAFPDLSTVTVKDMGI